MFGTNLILKQFLEKRGEYLSNFLTEVDRSLSVSSRFSKTFKDKFTNHKHKQDVILNSWHEVNTKKLEYFIVDNKHEPWYNSKPSADGFI